MLFFTGASQNSLDLTMVANKLPLVPRYRQVVRSVPFEAEAPYDGEIRDMESAALDGRAPRVTLAESRRTVETLTRLYTAAAA